MAKKMARQLYERNQVRFNVSERAFNREMLETRAGQKRLGASYSFSDSLTSEGSLGPHQSMLTTSQSGRHDVLPGDLLQSIERYSRNAGSLQHEKKSILPNGGLSRDGHREQVLPRFRVDPSQRETRRVVTGGSVDRLNYSDGSLLVLMPPKVVSADPTLASKPLILRDGSKPTVHSRTLPRADRPVTHAGELSMEVQHLSAVSLRSTLRPTFIPDPRARGDSAVKSIHHALILSLYSLNMCCLVPALCFFAGAYNRRHTLQ